MGKNGSRQTKKLKAATLLESVIAMSMMAAALSFAVGLHFRILHSDQGADKVQAWALTEELLAHRSTGSWVEQIERNEDFKHFEIQINEEVHSPGLIDISIVIHKGKALLLERRCIIPGSP